jgi:predicted tellurium resistance membrane protein TerC
VNGKVNHLPLTDYWGQYDFDSQQDTMELLNIISSVIALIILEIVLGIDNLVFLSILTEKLPREDRKKARRWGLTFAWVTRLMLLGSAVWLVKFTRPFLTIGQFSFSGRDFFLLAGGIFLLYKTTQEMHYEVAEPPSSKHGIRNFATTIRGVVIQIGLMDIVFSLDSVLTAIGLTSSFMIMSIAISCAILVMVYASEPVSQFIEKHPSIKMLALSFLILIGTMLIGDSFGFHMPRGYLYFSMGFSLFVEALNLIRQKKRRPEKVRQNS